MKSIWTQIFKISNACKNPQISNHDFLFWIKNIHRKEIGSSGGGTFPTEPELKQDPRNSTHSRTGIFPLRSETKDGFIYGIKTFFWTAQVRWFKSSLDNYILFTAIPPTIITAKSNFTNSLNAKWSLFDTHCSQFHFAMAGQLPPFSLYLTEMK